MDVMPCFDTLFCIVVALVRHIRTRASAVDLVTGLDVCHPSLRFVGIVRSYPHTFEISQVEGIYLPCLRRYLARRIRGDARLSPGIL